MKFEVIAAGKGLQITAENPAEVRTVIQHFKLDPFEYVEGIGTGSLVYVEKASGYQGTAEWHALTASLGPEWLAPYMDRLQRVTGYAGPIPTLELAATDWQPSGWLLSHTHHVDRASISPEGAQVHGYKMAGEWNGRTAAQYAVQLFVEYVRKDIGDEKREPEYIRLGNGLLKENPNYLKRHAPHAALTNSRLFGALVQWWMDTHATPGQRETLEKAFATYKTVCKTASLGEWLIREYSGYRLTWESGVISFEQFKGL
jgi:hypothetical protein